MILNNETLKEKELVNFGNHDPYMVLDLAHVDYSDERKATELAIEVLNKISVYTKINRFCSSIKSDFNLETDTIYKVQQFIQEGENKSLSNDEMRMYFLQEQAFYKFCDKAERLIDCDKLQSSREIEMVILGVPIENIAELDSKNPDFLQVDEDFNLAYLSFLNDQISYEEFMTEAIPLLFALVK